jgi:sugar diacid utilization regulator
MKLVGGENGTDRIIRWVYIGETMPNIDDTIDWIVGYELLIITGSTLNGNIQKVIDLMPRLNAKNIAGIIVNIGNYIPYIPSEMIGLANEMQLPLFELPWEARLVTVTHEIGSAIITSEMQEDSMRNLLENLLFSDISSNNLLDAFERVGFNADDNFLVGIIDIDDFGDYICKNKIKDESKIVGIKNCFFGATNETLINRHINALTMLKSDSVVFLAKCSDITRSTMKDIYNEIHLYMSERFPGLKLHAGVGKSCNHISLYKKSYHQAEQALLAIKSEQSESPVCYYKDTGVYLLLTNIKDRQILEEYYHDTFDNLIRYDEANKSNLIKTLKVYLSNNCKMSESAKQLYIHEKTLKYRLNRIETVGGFDMHDFQQLSRLDIGVKAGRLLYPEHNT